MMIRVQRISRRMPACLAFHHRFAMIPIPPVRPISVGVIRRCHSGPAEKVPAVKSACHHHQQHEQSSGVSILDSISDWLLTDNSLAPPVTTRFTIKRSRTSPENQSHTISISTFPPTLPKDLSKHDSITAISKLLSPLLLEQSMLSSITPPLNSSNLLRTLPSPPGPLSVEYSSPNIAKPLHMGHLRSTITGSYINNIARFAGHDTKSICFLGDWGRQFGILHAGVEQRLKETSVTKDFNSFIKSLNINELLGIYVEASKSLETNEQLKIKALEYSAELERTHGIDSNVSSLWNHTVGITQNHLKSCYRSLNIEFDEYQRESDYKCESSHVANTLKLLESRGISEHKTDGTVRLKGIDNYNVLLKSDKSTVYLMRDIACAVKRIDDSGSEKRRIVYVVDSGQSEHFKTLFWAVDKLGFMDTGRNSDDTSDDKSLPFRATLSHIPFNRVVGMSSRGGTAVLLSDVITEGTTLMHETRRKSKNARNTEDMSISEQLAVSGLIINSLKFKRMKAYEFDWSEALRSKGNTGVSLQYTVARVRSLMGRVREEIGVDGGSSFEVECRVKSLLESDANEVIMELLVSLMNFEDTFWKSYIQLEPCVLVTYCFLLSDKISRVLSTVRVLEHPDKEVAMSVAWVLGLGECVLQTCMGVLGVRPVKGGF